MAHIFKEVKFIKSSPDFKSCPEAVHPEYAFVGRSNVGKSSLINYLAGIKKLAKTSGNPGLTRLINHFFVDETWYLVDLPGYGYAKLGKVERSKFDKLIKDYLLKRETLICLFQLIDCRHTPQKNDLEFLTWLGENGVPFVLCFTKTDKLTPGQLNKAVDFYKTTLLKQWETLPQIFLTSVTINKGREEILTFIEETNKMLKTGSSIK
jgi:GTP-binding protein